MSIWDKVHPDKTMRFVVYTTVQGQVHPYLQRDRNKRVWSNDTHILAKVIHR